MKYLRALVAGILLATVPVVANADDWTHDPEASWYGPGFYGNRTACGLAYTKTILGVAHRSLPCGTLVEFRNPKNGRTEIVPVIDRGPYVSGRIWDLSGGLCVALDHCYTGPIDWRFPGASATLPPTDTAIPGPRCGPLPL